MNQRRLGVFVSGFRWSGSSAVCDWLNRYDSLARPTGTERSLGEIRALNYGVQALLLVAEGEAVFGERLARWALYPDPRLWTKVFGRSLYRVHGRRGKLYQLIDMAILMALKGKLRPGLGAYRAILNDHLGSDAIRDEQYLKLLREFVEALQELLDRRHIPLEQSSELTAAVSGLFELFYDRTASRGTVPLFDNTIAGMNARYYRLLAPTVFEKQMIYLVQRDPRDQFAEQVQHSVRTLPMMVHSFIRDYRANAVSAHELSEQFREDPARLFRVLSFEEFVCSEQYRRERADEVSISFSEFNLATTHSQGDFHPDQSRRNIGVWKVARLDRQMKIIAEELSQYLRQEAE